MDFKILDLLFRFNREYSHEKIRRKDLSDTEYLLCAYIRSNPDCSQDDAASALRIDKTTVAKALASLEEKNCVTRGIAKDDRRKKCLRITEEGNGRIADLLNVHNDWLTQVLSCLQPEEQTLFEEYCGRILRTAQTVAEKNGNGENNS